MTSQRTSTIPTKQQALVRDIAEHEGSDQDVTVLSDNARARAEALESVAKWEEKHGSFTAQHARTRYASRRSFLRR